MLRSVMLFLSCLMFAKSAFAQSENIGISPSDVLKLMSVAASKLSLEFDPQPEECGNFQCNWSIGNGIRFYSIGVNAQGITQLEANWSNANKDTSTASPGLYRNLCAIITASADPLLKAAEVWQTVNRIAIVESTKPLILKPEIRTSKQIFYGSRYRPELPGSNFSDEALFMCGVVANTGGEF